MKEVPGKSIDRRFLWQYVLKKINNSIHHAHVMSVINILLDEIVAELILNKKIKIINFGQFVLRKLNPRKHYNLYTKKYEMSKGNNILRFELNNKLRRFIIKNLDVAKTFLEPHDE